MRFNSEKGRLAHPQLGLIPTNIFNLIFLTSSHQMPQVPDNYLQYFEQDFKTLTSVRRLPHSYPFSLTRPHSYPFNLAGQELHFVIVCILIRFPNEPLESILSFAKLLDGEMKSSEIFLYCSALGNTKHLESFKTFYPSDVREFILKNSAQTFRMAFENNHLAVLNWITETLTLSLFKNRIPYRIFFVLACHQGFFPILEWFKTVVDPDEFATLLNPESQPFNESPPLRIACAKGDISMAEKLKELASPEQFQAMIEAGNFKAFQVGCEGGHCHTAEWLQKQALDQFPAMVAADNYRSFFTGIENGQSDTLKWLKKQAPEQFQVMIKEHNDRFYKACEIACAKGHLSTLQWLQEQIPEQFQAMIDKHGQSLFTTISIYQKGESRQIGGGMLHWILSFSSIFIYANTLCNKKGKYNEICFDVVKETLQTLIKQKSAFTRTNPKNIFDVDTKQADFYFYISGYLLQDINEKQKQRLLLALDLLTPQTLAHSSLTQEGPSDELRPNIDGEQDKYLLLLLDLPTLQTLAHSPLTQGGLSNELLRRALKSNKERVVQRLLSIPAVRQLAEQEQFYNDEVGDATANRLKHIAHQQSKVEVRKNARLLGQGYRTPLQENCFFSTIPPECLVHIASFTATPNMHTQEEVKKIAESSLAKPLT